jgi:hypothetical protein
MHLPLDTLWLSLTYHIISCTFRYFVGIYNDPTAVSPIAAYSLGFEVSKCKAGTALSRSIA